MNLAVKEQELLMLGEGNHGASSLVVVALNDKEALGVVGVQGIIVQPSLLEVALLATYANHVVNISSISIIHPTGNGH